jgi:tetratricopeptide (TPR) repeat protein/transcriptional regulator with XRE-family HTH domain
VTESPGDFAGLLRHLRQQAGLTQEELASKALLGVTTVSDLERGRHSTCHRPTAQRLADAMGLDGQVGPLFVAAARGLKPVATVLAAASGQQATTQAQPGRDERQPPSPPGVRYSLPPDAAAFTGRDSELDLIRAGGVVAIHAIDGMPGVGKTALAVHVAHRLRGQFPDRQLFIDLHGHTPGQEPVPAATALAGLLTAIGVEPGYLPDGVDGRAALWRDRMAGQRALLVLDNAESSSQVAPLLPGGRDSLVLVTSRRHLGDLPGSVTPIPVEALTPAEAQQMFLRLTRRATAGPAVATLVELAGYLPLAISLLARVHARHPAWTMDDLIAETRSSILTMAAENTSVAAVFELSYRCLDAPSQQFLRRLGLHLGAAIDAYAAAALAGIGVAEAAGHLDALHHEGLLTEVAYRRYGMHDLIRRYARERASTDPEAGRDQARQRLLDYYTHAAATAEVRLARQSRISPARPPASALTATSPAAPGPVPAGPVPAAPVAAGPVPTDLVEALPHLADSTQALTWARAERANLLGCLDHVTATGQQARVVALTAAMAALLQRDGPWSEAIARHTAAAQAAFRLGDRPGQAGALSELGVAQRISGNYPAATAALDQALAIYRELGDRLGQAGALSDLGVLERMTGHLADADRTLEQALVIYRELGDRLGEADALNYLGVVRRIAANFPAAATALAEALAVYRDLGHRLGQANALSDLAEVRRLTGDYPAAAVALDEALAINRDLGHRLGQANALNCLGVVRRLTGDYPGAAAALGQALGIYRDLGSRLGQANALTFLGVVERATLNYPRAAEALDEALAIYRELGDRGGEVEVLNEAGTLYLAGGDPARAGGCHRQALELAQAIGSAWDEGHALAGLGRCALATGDTDHGHDLLRRARELLHQLGAETTELAGRPDG